jgi:hypothetical protein
MGLQPLALQTPHVLTELLDFVLERASVFFVRPHVGRTPRRERIVFPLQLIHFPPQSFVFGLHRFLHVVHLRTPLVQYRRSPVRGARVITSQCFPVADPS